MVLLRPLSHHLSSQGRIALTAGLASLLLLASCSNSSDTTDENPGSADSNAESAPELLADSGTGSDSNDAATGSSASGSSASGSSMTGDKATGSSATTERGCEQPETVCVGVALAPGAIELSYIMSDLERIEAELASTVEVLEAEDVTQLGYKVEDFASDAFDIIIIGGDPNGTLVLASADRYPEITFIALESIPAAAFDAAGPETETWPNLISLSFANRDSGFLAGSLAALTSQSGKVAAIIGPDLDPAAVEFKTGFEAGAQFINPQIQLFTSFHPGGSASGYHDPLWAATKTRKAVEQGVDVVVGYGGITGSAALVEAARHDGSVSCIGTMVDHQQITPEASPCLIASAQTGVAHVLFDTIRAHLGLESEAGSETEPITGSAMEVAAPVPATLGNVNGDVALGEAVSGDIVAQMDEIIEALRNGSITSG